VARYDSKAWGLPYVVMSPERSEGTTAAK
jgi:hypothetical protein